MDFLQNIFLSIICKTWYFSSQANMAGTDGKGEYAAVEKKEKVILILLTMFIFLD